MGVLGRPSSDLGGQLVGSHAYTTREPFQADRSFRGLCCTGCWTDTACTFQPVPRGQAKAHELSGEQVAAPANSPEMNGRFNAIR